MGAWRHQLDNAGRRTSHTPSNHQNITVARCHRVACTNPPWEQHSGCSFLLSSERQAARRDIDDSTRHLQAQCRGHASAACSPSDALRFVKGKPHTTAAAKYLQGGQHGRHRNTCRLAAQGLIRLRGWGGGLLATGTGAGCPSHTCTTTEHAGQLAALASSCSKPDVPLNRREERTLLTATHDTQNLNIDTLTHVCTLLHVTAAVFDTLHNNNAPSLASSMSQLPQGRTHKNRT
jgi:hypothetical protein